MNRKEEGNYSHNSNQHPNSDMELTNEVQLLNDYAGLSSSVTANKSDSDVNGADKNGGNFVGVEDENKSNEMKQEGDEREINSEDNNNLHDLTPEEIVLAQNMLGNHLILRKILNNIPLHQILCLRLVNKLWEEEATSIILNNPPFSIFLKYHPRQRCYYVYKDSSCLFVSTNNGTKEQKPKKGKPLSELNNCISSSRRFPCSCFEIINRLDVETEDMTEFLRLHGEEIKIAGFRDMKVASHRTLLEKIPNIHKLRISSIGSSIEGGGGAENNKENLLFPNKKVTLPHLKSLYFVPYSSQISEIILASPNLQEIERDGFEAVDALVSMEKIHLIKHLNLSPKDFKSIELLQKWAEAKPKLVNLSLNKPYYSSTNSNVILSSTMGKSLTKILWSSRETLKSIYMCLQEEYFNDVLWPSFDGLQVLSVWNERGNLQLFPPNFISNIFSTITKLYIGNPEPSYSINSFLITDVQLHCLKIVHIQTGYAELLFLLLRAAPNLEELTLHRITEFFTSVGFIWQFSKLKKLYISSWYNQLFLHSQFPQLDMAITGFSEEIVRRLHENPVYFEEMKMKGQEITRVTPSILDCKALETFTLKFEGLGGGVGNTILFTSISGEFGFKLMKHVNVQLSCTPECEVAFQPLNPYVEVVVEHPRTYNVWRYA